MVSRLIPHHVHMLRNTFLTVQRCQREGRSKKTHWRRPEPLLYRWLKRAGRWVEQAGFTAGLRVKVNVEHGRLTITAE